MFPSSAVTGLVRTGTAPGCVFAGGRGERGRTGGEDGTGGQGEDDVNRGNTPLLGTQGYTKDTQLLKHKRCMV
jgi:hypothetical protein